MVASVRKLAFDLLEQCAKFPNEYSPSNNRQEEWMCENEFSISDNKLNIDGKIKFIVRQLITRFIPTELPFYIRFK